MKNGTLTKEDTRTTGRSIVPHRPRPMFPQLNAEMNRLFDEFGKGFGLWQPEFRVPGGECEMKIDIKDSGNDLVVTAELPGVEMQDIEITATPHYISLVGEKKSESGEHNDSYYHLEREYGYFRRVLHLPSEIDKDKIDAVFKNGVLTLTMPKTKAALANERKITVKAG